jgi:hypothetical protein
MIHPQKQRDRMSSTMQRYTIEQIHQIIAILAHHWRMTGWHTFADLTKT